MKTDAIVEVRQDPEGRISVQPAMAKFPYAYREAMGVDWDPALGVLRSPVPREWGAFEWFEQIVKLAREQCYVLQVTPETRFLNVTREQRERMVELAGK